MTLLQVVSDIEDGATYSESQTTTGFPPNPGSWQRASLQGTGGVVPDPAAAPLTSSYVRAGGWVGGSGDNWARASFVAWWIFKLEAGFLLPVGTHLVDANFRVTRQAFTYTDHNNWYGDDSYYIKSEDWTPPLSGNWVNLFSQEAVDSTFFSDATWRKLLSDRSSGVGTGGEGAGNFYIAGGEGMRTAIKAKLAAGQPMGLAAFAGSSTKDYPGAKFWVHDFSSANSIIQLANRPTLSVNLLKIHDLNYVLGASAQMTDGTAVFLRYNRATAQVGLWYQRVSQTVATLIGNLDTTSASTQYFDVTQAAAQCLSICIDTSNNIYVVGGSGNASSIRKITVTGYRYNGGYSWTKQTTNTTDGDAIGSPDYHRGSINNVSAIWLPNAGGSPGGALAIQFGRRSAQWSYNETGTEVVNAGFYLGTAGVAKFPDYGYVEPINVWGTVWHPFNPAGTGLDSLFVGGKILTISNCQAAAKSTKTRNGVHSCTVTPESNFVTAPIFISQTLVEQSHDADSKLRNVWMNSNIQYCTFRGTDFVIRNISDNSLFRSFDFSTLGITNYPSKAQAESDAIWDIVYDQGLNCFWIYYVDSQNPRHVRKVRYDHITNTLYASVALTGSPQGPSGSRIWALRAPRGKVDVRAILLDLAIQSAAGAPEVLVTLRDLTANIAPNVPVLDPISAFNATSIKNFDWTFSDPNTGDWATSQDVEIRRVSTGATVHTSGKVAATLVSGSKYRYALAAGVLTNDLQYQIRVRSYDAVDVVGPWTAWTSFSTQVTGGTVTILVPQTDNELLSQNSVTVTWSYSNTNGSITQTGYVVRVYNHSTNALVSDTGVVTSTATTHTVTSLTSDIQYRIEVQVQGSDSLISGAGIRLVFPDFDNPSIPGIVAQQMPGYVSIQITNPPPTGQNPLTTSNQIARKEEGALDSTYIVVGTTTVNGIFNDYSVASGKRYTYKARGAAAGPVYGGWSNLVTESATVTGTWIQDPVNPTTVIHLPYGGVGKQEGRDRAKTAMQFVGRAYPVYDLGEARAETIQVTTRVFGTVEAAAVRPLGDNIGVILYRDGRGRKMYGIISDWSMTDERMGSYTVSFLVNRVDYNEALAAPT